MVEIEDLKKDFEKVVNKYVKFFCKKQGVKHKSIKRPYNGVIGIGDTYLDIDDIIWDVNTRQPVGWIFDWVGGDSPLPFDEYTQNRHLKGFKGQ